MKFNFVGAIIPKAWIPPLAVLGVIALVFLGRALHFHLRYRFLKEAARRHSTYAEQPASRTYEDPSTLWLQEHTQRVKRYVLEAGVENPVIRWMEPAGLGFAQQRGASVLDNWLLLTPAGLAQEVMPAAHNLIIRAYGHYRDERDRNLNPLYWIESLVFLPKRVLPSVGIQKPSVMNALQVLYWAATIALTFYGLRVR